MLFAILFLALTRSEIIERMRTPPVVMVQGLVAVYADCDGAQRREFQHPVAGFAADVCRTLYAGSGMHERKFEHPGIVISVGDSREADTNVVSSVKLREGERYLKITLPSPGYSDREALRVAVARGFFLAVKGEDLDALSARRALREVDPRLRAGDQLNELGLWQSQGVSDTDLDDEEFLKIMRTVHLPGVALAAEKRIFASRMYLYPDHFRWPFAGKYESLSLRDAIRVRHRDPRVRLAAFNKITETVTFGGGHGEAMDEVVAGYCGFLTALAKGVDNDAELFVALDELEKRLKGLEQ